MYVCTCICDIVTMVVGYVCDIVTMVVGYVCDIVTVGSRVCM